MDLGLSGKVALVAASSKGLGKASALALAREGARVTICARERGGRSRLPPRRSATRPAPRCSPSRPTSTSADEIEQRGRRHRRALRRRSTCSSTTPAARRAASSPTSTDDDWRRGFEVVTLNFVRFVRAVAAAHARARLGADRRHPVELGEAAGRRHRPLERDPPRRRRADEGAHARPRQGRHHDQPRAARHVPDLPHPPRPGERRPAGARAGARGAARAARRDDPAGPPRRADRARRPRRVPRLRAGLLHHRRRLPGRRRRDLARTCNGPTSP